MKVEPDMVSEYALPDVAAPPFTVIVALEQVLVGVTVNALVQYGTVLSV